MKIIFNTISETPGVYLFYNKHGKVIYVGKATNLRSRVRSYFRGQRTSRPIEQMMHEVARVEHRPTDSALEALILESNLIHELQPQYNVEGKDDKSWNYVCVTKDAYPRIQTVRGHELIPSRQRQFAYVFGPYTSGTSLKKALKILRKLFSYSTCMPGASRPCLYRQMGQCLGVCTGEISSRDYRKRVITPLAIFLGGKKKILLKRLQQDMRAASLAHDYEEAARVRDQLKALQHIQDIALINKEFTEDTVTERPLRIEGYDIAHISGTSMVGSMVVFNAEGPVKSHYRKFRIKTVVGSNDTASLKEVLERRLTHPEWPYPDIFLIDGGSAQLNAVHSVLQESSIIIPIVGIAKGPERKHNDFSYKPTTTEFAEWVSKHKPLLIQVRDEAHRFAQRYHKTLRARSSLK
ncbi:MAG TPA: hypothetical protein DDW36_04590 [Candidatus Magasanikbacteria bacterium]|nr:hypothetical protein [Candidatus Magasanikbacteria bacterium]